MNLICINCNNIFRWKVIVDNLPSNIDKYKLLVVTDYRLGDKVEVLKRMCPKAEVIEVQTIISKYANEISLHENISKLALAMKLIEPWYISKTYNPDKFIILDDDIVMNEKIDELFDNVNVNAVHRFGFLKFNKDGNNLSDKLRKLALVVNGINYDEPVKYVNGGHLVFSKEVNFDTYILRVRDYMESPVMTEVIANQKNWKSFYVDEVFFCGVYAKFNKQFEGVYDLKNWVKCHQIIPAKTNFKNFGKVMKKYGITHFAHSDKMVAYEELIKLGYLKYEENKYDEESR